MTSEPPSLLLFGMQGGVVAQLCSVLATAAGRHQNGTTSPKRLSVLWPPEEGELNNQGFWYRELSTDPRAKAPVLSQKGSRGSSSQGVPALSRIENAVILVLRRRCCASWLWHRHCQVLRKGKGLSAVRTVPACFNKIRWNLMTQFLLLSWTLTSFLFIKLLKL